MNSADAAVVLDRVVAAAKADGREDILLIAMYRGLGLEIAHDPNLGVGLESVATLWRLNLLKALMG